MAPDKLQQAWQSQLSETRITVNADLLREQVQSEDQTFRSTIFWRDFREVAVGLLLIPVWIYLGATTSQPWSWYLTIPACIWIVGFMVAFRMRHSQTPESPDEPLRQCVERSLVDVENQIWLLRNVFWWYLLPFCISMSAYFVHVAWDSSSVWWEWAAALACPVLFVAALYWWVLFAESTGGACAA